MCACVCVSVAQVRTQEMFFSIVGRPDECQVLWLVLVTRHRAGAVVDVAKMPGIMVGK